jgi:hypothetical protein
MVMAKMNAMDRQLASQSEAGIRGAPIVFTRSHKPLRISL